MMKFMVVIAVLIGCSHLSTQQPGPCNALCPNTNQLCLNLPVSCPRSGCQPSLDPRQPGNCVPCERPCSSYDECKTLPCPNYGCQQPPTGEPGVCVPCDRPCVTDDECLQLPCPNYRCRFPVPSDPTLPPAQQGTCAPPCATTCLTNKDCCPNQSCIFVAGTQPGFCKSCATTSCNPQGPPCCDPNAICNPDTATCQLPPSP